MEGRPADDSDLIARAQRGDAAAYEEIVQRYQQIAFRTAYVVTGSAADAEDAAQEGFVRACRAPWPGSRLGSRRQPVPDLEQQLAALASEIEWPATPLHLWGGVRLIRTEGSTRWHWQRWGRPLAVAAASLLIVAIALAAYPPSRAALARWVNLHTIIP